MPRLIDILGVKEGSEKTEAFFHFLQHAARSKHVPLHGSFELTPRCTLNCGMCYVHLQPSQMARKELTAGQWISLIDQAADEGMMQAALTGGECMLHPGFRDIVHHLACVAGDLPEAVAADVATMEASRFANESDYDQRVTKLFVFKHDGDLARRQTSESLKALAQALGVPEAMVQAVGVPRCHGKQHDALHVLESLYVGTEFVEQTSLYHFALETLGDAAALIVTFGPEGVDLYPGGGYTTDFAVWITKDYVVYAKREGWNS